MPMRTRLTLAERKRSKGIHRAINHRISIAGERPKSPGMADASGLGRTEKQRADRPLADRLHQSTLMIARLVGDLFAVAAVVPTRLQAGVA
jgi:hypothetical protein